MTQLDPHTLPEADFNGLPLPDPYPEYLTCPHCGEREVEVFCYQAGAHCHTCGGWVDHPRPACFGSEHCWAVLSGLKDQTRGQEQQNLDG